MQEVKTDDKIDTPELEITAGSEETREAMVIFPAVSSKSRATRDLITIYPTESSESLETQQTINSVKLTVSLPTAINPDKKLTYHYLSIPLPPLASSSFGVNDTINSLIYKDTPDHNNEYS